MKDLFANVVRTDVIDKLSYSEAQALAELLHINNEKELPDWYGIPGIKFRYQNNMSDAEIIYKGRTMAAPVVEDTMWARFREECHSESERKFRQYMRNHVDDIKGFFEPVAV